MQDLAQKYVDDIKEICNIIAAIEGYKDRISHIADDFGKTSNSLSDERAKLAFWQMVATGTVSSKEAQSKRFASNDGEFRLKIIKIVCYWIYRLRCSVVHHRIGGYILKNEDDDLIVEVGERLTRCMLTSMFQNTKLQGLL